MSIERRLRELEEHTTQEETLAESEKRRKEIREQAEHANHCRKPEPAIFEIAENGDVFCTHDGRPVTDSHQTLAEEFYWMEVGWGPSPGSGRPPSNEKQPIGKLRICREEMRTGAPLDSSGQLHALRRSLKTAGSDV